jgi:uracil-DNA glycosylase
MISEITTNAKFLCNLCDCTSIGNKGDDLVKNVFIKFPYSNCYIDRISTRKPTLGTINIKGDGKENRYVVNFFDKFYPGTSKYPNDNVSKRLEWFVECLEKMLDIDDVISVAFPTTISDKYIDKIKDFKNKYYIKHGQHLKIVDYQNNDMFNAVDIKHTYEPPITIIKTEYIPPKFNIVKTINIDKLIFITGTDTEDSKEKDQEKVLVKTDVCKKPEKLKINIKSVKDTKPVDLQPTLVASVAYDKNPQWVNKSISHLIDKLDETWNVIFKDKKMIEVISQLDTDFKKELAIFGDHIEILPSDPELLFNSFKLCKFPPKCVILGQDPYYANLDEAMGLSFSVPDEVKCPPSLTNIFKELSSDIKDFNVPKSGNLSSWASNGVLLLNTALSVRYKQKESHLKMWKLFTNAVIELISSKSQTPIVFMLWGSPAKSRRVEIEKYDINKGHLILEATHPSPLGANQGGWFGCKHFSKCNDFLTKNGIDIIDWKLS